MKERKRAWAIRPYPHDIYRMREFTENRMVAIGWPATRDLTGCSREAIRERLRESYYQSATPQSLGQAVGIVDRFVNQIRVGHAVVVPDGNMVYFGVVVSSYSFKPHLQSDDEGYPHWIGVRYMFRNNPILRVDLPAVLFDSLKGRQAVFGLPSETVWDVIDHQDRYLPVDPGVEQQTRDTYRDNLSKGTVPGVNSPRFEEAVLKVLSLYYPGLVRLPTTNAPENADTDLKTSLPGGIVVRVQVKCYQDNAGALGEAAVQQLRNSMEPGEHGVLVTTNQISGEARKAAEFDPERPIGLISGDEFAQLVFDNLEHLTDSDLWKLGLRRTLNTR